MELTRERILAFSPRARADVVEALVQGGDTLRSGGITSNLRLAHFLAQIATETGGLRRLDENLNYSEKALLATFGRKRVPADKAKVLSALTPLEVKQRAIANWLYGEMLGNRGRDTDDGWNYRGSGFIQLTGRDNFKARGAEVQLPFEAEPALVRQAEQGLIAAVSYWRARNVNSAADDDDITRVRMLVNGPRVLGLNEARIWHGQARTVLLAGAAGRGGGTTLEAGQAFEPDAVAEVLRQRGFGAGATEAGSAAGDAREADLRAYQHDRGLTETGVFDEDTLYAITDPIEWRGDLTEVTTGSTEDPEGTVSFDLGSGAIAKPQVQAVGSVAVSTESGMGTGEQLREQGLTPEEMRQFANSVATYAPYEKPSLRRDGRGNYIPYSIIGEDDRKIVLGTMQLPARAITQILFTSSLDRRQQDCSGALVGRDFVLTAGHCVHSGTLDGVWHRDFALYPGRNTGNAPFGRCRAKKVYTLSGWVNAPNALAARYYDLGGIKLDCNVGTYTGWFALASVPDNGKGQQVVVQGYPTDSRSVPGRQYYSIESFREIQELKVFYKNDTYGGMSGSPVFAVGGSSIIAVHTNGLHGREYPWNEDNAGTRITAVRLASIRAWIDD